MISRWHSLQMTSNIYFDISVLQCLITYTDMWEAKIGFIYQEMNRTQLSTQTIPPKNENLE